MSRKGKLQAGVTSVAIYTLILLPAALAFLYVHRFGVNVVWGDSWGMVSRFDELASGTLGISDLWSQHTNHRIFFPRIAMLALGTLTGWNAVAEMYLILTCFLGTLVALLLVFRSNIRMHLPVLLPVSFLPISLLVFSLGQHRNMLWGFQIGFAFAQVFSVLTLFLLYLLGRNSYRKVAFPAALASGVLASFSVAQGLFVWPVGLLQLLISPIERRAKRLLIGVWSLFGVGAWVLFFIGYESPERHESYLGYLIEHPVFGAQYFLTLLGSSLFWQQSSALAGGLLLAGLAGVALFLVYRGGGWGEHSFWVGLLFFSFLTLASITAGRAGLDNIQQALASKYTTFSLLAVVGVYAMLVKLALERWSRFTGAALGALAVVVLLSVPVSYSEGAKAGAETQELRERVLLALSTYEYQPNQRLNELYPNPRFVKVQAPTLERLGYSVFAGPGAQSPYPPLSELSPAASGTRSQIDTVSGVRVGQEDQPVAVPEDRDVIRVSGWAVDERAGSAAGGVYVSMDGDLFPAFYGSTREGVAERFEVPAYEESGFVATIPGEEIEPGTRELSIVVLTNDREGYYRPDQEVTVEVE